MKRGWQKKKLGEVCIVERGSSPRPIDKYITASDDGVNWIKIGDTKGVTKYIHTTKEKITQQGALHSRYVKTGDFILTNSMSFGKPFIMKTDGYIHDGWFVIRLSESIDTDFFYYLLSSRNIQEQIKLLSTGAIVKNISGDLIKQVELTFPSDVPEQKRIVEILDKAFAAIDKAKANAEQNLKNAKELFDALIEQRLFKSEQRWTEKKLIDVCLKITQGPNPKYDKKGIAEYKVIKTKDLYDDVIHYTKADEISREVFESCKSSELQNGDVLLAIVGQGSINKCNVFQNSTSSRFLFTRAIGLLRTDQKVLSPNFLKYYLQSGVGKRLVDSGINGTSGQQVVTTTHLKNIKIPLPPLSQQNKLVAEFHKFSLKVKELQRNYRRDIDMLGEMKKSLLQKAFSGELTQKAIIELT
jgi:type I restriction enzyme S subunit